MKRSVTISTLIFLLGCQSNQTQVRPVAGSQVAGKATTTPAVPSFQWVQNYDLAVAAAKENKKLVMVDMYTDWCGWCKKLDQDVYANAEVQSKLAVNFIGVKVNPERSERGAQLAQQFGTRAFPDIVFVDGSGKKVSEILGYVPAADFGKVLDTLVKNFGQ